MKYLSGFFSRCIWKEPDRLRDNKSLHRLNLIHYSQEDEAGTISLQKGRVSMTTGPVPKNTHVGKNRWRQSCIPAKIKDQRLSHLTLFATSVDFM